MMQTILFELVALTIAFCFACRVDLLSWSKTPVLMLLHALGGSATLWALLSPVSGGVDWRHVAVLVASTLLLAVTYRHLEIAPSKKQEPPEELPSRAIERVSGGVSSELPERRP